MRKKALIFYISKYSGHYQAARAIEQGLIKVAGELDVEKINALDYTNPILGSVINKTYLEIIKKKPEIWGNIYDNPRVMKNTMKARDVLHKFNMAKIRKLLDSYSPDFVICTQAFPCGMVADYKKSGGRKIPLIGVLTDHAPHSYWLFDEVDFYVVPSATTGRVLAEKGVPREKIRVYGIPVDPKFAFRHDARRIREDLRLAQDKPTVLIMGGSQGLGAVEDVARSLLKDGTHHFQLLVVTGTNKKLNASLAKLSRSTRGTGMRVFSHIENIDELMEAADVIVTKAGGMTTAEALVKNLPILVVDPIPGHERMNADYLVKENAAIEISDISRVHQIIAELFNSKGALSLMRSEAKRLSMPDSALEIAKLALSGVY